MSSFADHPISARHDGGKIHIVMESGLEIAFPVKGNSRLEGKPSVALDRIEISPSGLHWPELDENLSIRGILAGDWGQTTEPPPEGGDWRRWRGALAGSSALEDHVREHREEVEEP